MENKTCNRQGRGIAGAALLLLVLPALAATDVLEGTVDGEQRRWHIVEANGISTAEFSEHTEGMLGVTVQGHTRNQFAMEGAIAINFTVMDGNPVGDMEVSYFPTDSVFPMYTSIGGGDWTLDPVAVAGNRARVSGSYSGELARVENKHDDPDPGDTITVDLRFDVFAKRSE